MFTSFQVARRCCSRCHQNLSHITYCFRTPSTILSTRRSLFFVVHTHPGRNRVPFERVLEGEALTMLPVVHFLASKVKATDSFAAWRCAPPQQVLIYRRVAGFFDRTAVPELCSTLIWLGGRETSAHDVFSCAILMLPTCESHCLMCSSLGIRGAGSKTDTRPINNEKKNLKTNK